MMVRTGSLRVKRALTAGNERGYAACSMPRTVVGPETRVGGPLTGKDELVVEGTVDGPITGEGTVTIAAGARVGGEVRGRDVIIGGALHHPVHAAATIRLLATAEVYGDLHAPRIAIDDGAVCEGALHMGRKRSRTNANEPAALREIPSLPGIGKRKLVRR